MGFESNDELGKIGMQPHVAILCLVNVRELVEQPALWGLAVYSVVLFTVCWTRQHAAAKSPSFTLTELQYGVSSVNVHLLFSARAEKVKVGGC